MSIFVKQCSIDALLERTIKHMLFLQNVSKHADKLKQTGESKVTRIIIFWRLSSILVLSILFFVCCYKITKDEGGGATWAFEVGSKSLVCPIVVEDLKPPRIFQIEVTLLPLLEARF